MTPALPIDEEAERCLIGALLEGGQPDEDFQYEHIIDERRRVLLQAADGLREEGLLLLPPDSLAVGERRQRAIANAIVIAHGLESRGLWQFGDDPRGELAQCIESACHPGLADYYCRRLRDAFERRQHILSAQATIATATKGNGYEHVD